MTTFNVGDRVKFTGIDATAQDRKDQDIDGTQGAWPDLTVGAVGTITETASGSTKQPENNRLFVKFDGIPCPMDDLSFILGMPEGWPVLTSEVESVESEVAA